MFVVLAGIDREDSGVQKMISQDIRVLWHAPLGVCMIYVSVRDIRNVKEKKITKQELSEGDNDRAPGRKYQTEE